MACVNDTVTAFGTLGAFVVAAAALLLSIFPVGPAKRAIKHEAHQAKLARIAAEAAATQVEVTKDQLDQDWAAFETSIRPLIVDAPLKRDNWAFGPKDPTVASPPDEEEFNVWWDGHGKTISTSGARMLVRNVGNGLAFVHDVRIVVGPEYSVKPESTKRLSLPASLDRNVIPEGETARFRYVIPNHTTRHAKPLRDAIRDGSAYIVITYTDLPGQQRLLSKIFIEEITWLERPDGNHLLKAKKVELYRCLKGWTSEARPFATTDPEE
jgi:hypothetical protein